MKLEAKLKAEEILKEKKKIIVEEIDDTPTI